MLHGKLQLSILTLTVALTATLAFSDQPALRSVQVTLPNQEHNVIKKSWPSIGCWFWMDQELKPQGYKRFLDLQEKYTPIALLTTSLRVPGQLKDPKIHDLLKDASEYALKKGMPMVLDLDLRLARKAFKERYPDELQQIVLLREAPLKATGSVMLTVDSIGFSDHYTFRDGPKYDPLSIKLQRVYSYQKENGLAQAGTVTDITKRSHTQKKNHALEITLECNSTDRGRTACALVAVTIYTPDLFSPHLLSYQRELIMQYSDASLAGSCKDEWGFPGRIINNSYDLWYSPFMADAYAQKRPGHDLLQDMLLMYIGEQGKENERASAVNHYMQMYWQRNSQIENDHYDAVKQYLGQDAMVATHPTWYAYPGKHEIFKNGLDWWFCKRDLAQTDESAPFCARTALAKKWHSPLWYNMFYDSSILPYEEHLWRAVLGGGRLNYHPRWPTSDSKSADYATNLLDSNLFRAETRVQLLNYISATPIDCPVALIFGHPAALNWTQSQTFADVGMELSNALWKAGFYADLIPSSEIANQALIIAPDGTIRYGAQSYAAAILYHPQYERPLVAEFFQKAAEKDKTKLYCIGDWTMDFEGKPIDGKTALPAQMKHYDIDTCAKNVIAQLKTEKIFPQTSCTMHSDGGYPPSMMPKPSGQCQLIDGTVILASGQNDVMGDPVKKTIHLKGQTISFDAIGIAAVRLDDQGQLEALACGGLKSFQTDSLSIDLPERIDFALFKENGKWRGIVHGHLGNLPPALTKITNNWTHLRLPEPYASAQSNNQNNPPKKAPSPHTWTPEVIVDIDVNDEVLIRKHQMTEADVEELVNLLHINGCDTLLVRMGDMGLLPYRTKLSYPMSFDLDNFNKYPNNIKDREKAIKLYTDLSEKYAKVIEDFNPPEVFIRQGHKRGMKVIIWIDIFDDYYPGHRSKFIDEHPYCQWTGKDGKTYFHGLINYAWPQARAFRVAQAKELLALGADGIHCSTSAHCRHMPNVTQLDYYGYGQPIVDAYKAKYGVDIRSAENFDKNAWHDIKGQFMNQLYKELADLCHQQKKELWIGLQLGKHTHHSAISYFGTNVVARYTNHWKQLVDEGIADAFILGDYELVSDPNTPYWKAKKDIVLQQGENLFDWTAKTYQDYCKDRCKLLLFSEWLPHSYDELDKQMDLWATRLHKYKFDGIDIHEAMNFEDVAIKNGFDILKKFSKKAKAPPK